MKIYPIPPGLYCVPSALVALTGEDFESVIFPALNRAQGDTRLTFPVAAVNRDDYLAVLDQLGYVARAARDPQRHKVKTWTKRALNRAYPNPLLLRVPGHVVVLWTGRVYDSLAPHGPLAADHPCADQVATHVWLVQPKKGV